MGTDLRVTCRPWKKLKRHYPSEGKMADMNVTLAKGIQGHPRYKDIREVFSHGRKAGYFHKANFLAIVKGERPEFFKSKETHTGRFGSRSAGGRKKKKVDRSAW